MTNKTYADGNGTAYEYTADGKLSKRIWARGITTTYSYTNTTGEMIGIDYSDSTPDISFSYDRLGRQTQITDAQGTRTFSYNPASLVLTNETIVAGGVTSIIARTQDSYGRPSGFSFGNDYQVDYGYSGVGRFETVDSAVLGVTNNWQYSYLQNSGLIENLIESNAGVTNSRSYEANRNLLTEIHNQAQGVTISKYQYSNDALGRRTQRIDTTASVTTNDFGYDARSQLTNAIMGAESFAWDFDNIGNRETYTTNGTTYTYLANELNQYTNIANGTTNSPTYDLDGNTLTYKGWMLEWTGENRLKSASNGSTVVSFQYDYMGRRFSKIVDGVSTNLLYYDGWNLIAEKSGGETTHHVWGLDLSGSMQGAGGVGGLLETYTDSSMYLACADGNGNVTDYTDTTGTNVVAHYVFGAYGEILDSSGDKVDDFNILFSSKYLDRETAVPGCPGMYYYGYRYLWDARWVSRDPIGEEGGLNVYMAFRNTSLCAIDPVGGEAVSTTGEGWKDFFAGPSADVEVEFEFRVWIICYRDASVYRFTPTSDGRIHRIPCTRGEFGFGMYPYIGFPPDVEPPANYRAEPFVPTTWTGGRSPITAITGCPMPNRTDTSAEELWGEGTVYAHESMPIGDAPKYRYDHAKFNIGRWFSLDGVAGDVQENLFTKWETRFRSCKDCVFRLPIDWCTETLEVRMGNKGSIDLWMKFAY